MKNLISLCCLACCTAFVHGQEADTLAPLTGKPAPANFQEMWAGFDPRSEPLEVEVLHEWEEGDIVLRIVRFRIGVFKGKKATLAGVYGFSKSMTVKGKRVPGLLQIHGGGQYADANACRTNAKRGYATISIAWAGRINAPDYRVTPDEVKLFWDEKTDDPAYKLTTDWGAVDGYHAPGRNAGNVFPSAKPAAWTLDAIESPRNSGWFLCALAARRALTFLEHQPEVDPERLGVYGHSMGGKLTVMTAVDPRVKVAAPSCGGISDRDNESELFRVTLGDDVSLKEIACPTFFLSPSNDFHGRIGDLPNAVREIKSQQWRVTCSPHHNHQDTSAYEVATQLWFDEHLYGRFTTPKTPTCELQLQTKSGVPSFSVKPDTSKKVLAVDVFYTQHGKADETPRERENTMHRFWHHANAVESSEQPGQWSAVLPLSTVDKPLWVYANVHYALDAPIIGAGYYYGTYTATSFNVSSLLKMVSPADLTAAKVQATRKASLLIEDFQDGWQKEWFTYRPDNWARSTHKLYDATWQAPAGAKLALEVRANEPNQLVVSLDGYAADVALKGGDWQKIILTPNDFSNAEEVPLTDWTKCKRLKLSAEEKLRAPRGSERKPRVLGKPWMGDDPQFRKLRWLVDLR